MDNILKKQVVGFTQISNSLLNSELLSFKAKGLYAYLFSKPDGWNFSGKRMIGQTKDGADSIYSGLRELEEAGYINRHRLSTGRMEYELCTQTSLFGKIPNRENPKQGKSPLGKIPTISNKESLATKSISKKEKLVTAPTGASIKIKNEIISMEELTYEPVDGKRPPKSRYKAKTMFLLTKCYLEAAGIELVLGETYDAGKISKSLSKLLHQFKDPDRVMQVIREAGEYFNSKGLSWTPEAVWRDWEMIQKWKQRDEVMVFKTNK